jgi:hypothetical protein
MTFRANRLAVRPNCSPKRKVLFAADEYKFAVHEHIFMGGEHKFTERKYRIALFREMFG